MTVRSYPAQPISLAAGIAVTPDHHHQPLEANMAHPNSPMAALPLISFRAPPGVQRAIDARGANWHIHAIEYACGPVNLDNYRIQILQQPKERGLESLEGLLNYIRLNINDFVSREKATFAPYDDADRTKWRSNAPVGAVIHIDLGGAGALNPEDGSVVCSSYTKTDWIFSTIWTLADLNHPVSGNRQFGCYSIKGPGMPDDGSYIYTRAADRITDNIVNGFLMDTIFKGGHETWLGFQRKVWNFVNLKGGKARILPAFSARYGWNEMKAAHKPIVEWVVDSRHYRPGEPRDPDRELSTRGGPI